VRANTVYAFVAVAEAQLREHGFESAEKSAREAIAAAERTGETDNVYSAFARGILGDVHLEELRYKEAAEEYSAALKAYERHYESIGSPSNVELMGAVRARGRTLSSEGKYAEAAVESEKEVSLTREIFGVYSDETAGMHIII
jgi:tetratricopeptide (TPR) repeat protein